MLEYKESNVEDYTIVDRASVTHSCKGYLRYDSIQATTCLLTIEVGLAPVSNRVAVARGDATCAIRSIDVGARDV